jgi:hypothetical protein
MHDNIISAKAVEARYAILSVVSRAGRGISPQRVTFILKNSFAADVIERQLTALIAAQDLLLDDGSLFLVSSDALEQNSAQRVAQLRRRRNQLIEDLRKLELEIESTQKLTNKLRGKAA